MLIIVGRCLILILVGGSVAFGPKYIETQFTLPAWKSNLVIGISIYQTFKLQQVQRTIYHSVFNFLKHNGKVIPKCSTNTQN